MVERSFAWAARIRRQFVEQGLEAALERKRLDRGYAHTFDGTTDAHLVALACSRPPAGRERWTVRRLADEVVRLEVVDAVSGRLSAETTSDGPWRSRVGKTTAAMALSEAERAQERGRPLGPRRGRGSSALLAGLIPRLQSDRTGLRQRLCEPL